MEQFFDCQLGNAIEQFLPRVYYEIPSWWYRRNLVNKITWKGKKQLQPKYGDVTPATLAHKTLRKKQLET
jgi:hypothetical protein